MIETLIGSFVWGRRSPNIRGVCSYSGNRICWEKNKAGHRFFKRSLKCTGGVFDTNYGKKTPTTRDESILDLIGSELRLFRQKVRWIPVMRKW